MTTYNDEKTRLTVEAIRRLLVIHTYLLMTIIMILLATR